MIKKELTLTKINTIALHKRYMYNTFNNKTNVLGCISIVCVLLDLFTAIMAVLNNIELAEGTGRIYIKPLINTRAVEMMSTR